jgi:serpin B
MKLFNWKTQEKKPASMAAAVQGNTQFALDLYQKLRPTKGNLFFSPYSISTALAITVAGARGDTQAQISQALHFPRDQKSLHPAFGLLRAKLEQAGEKGHVQLKIANTLWPKKGHKFLKEFLVLARKSYGVQITPLDFGDAEAARHTINSWVEERTQSKIKDLIPAGVLDSLTRLVLVNAIYFKGNWATQFDPGLTSEAPFLVAENGQAMAPMMNRKHSFRYGESRDLQILELPYGGNDLSMIVLLPRETDGLAKLEDSLVVENLEPWIKDLAETEVQVSLPRFEIAFPFRLDDILKSLGMVDSFSVKADFSGLDGSKELYIGAALHKAFVAVNEQGTEAAAATAVIVQLKSLSFPAVVFRADHPFVFLIRENGTGSILFIGRMANPV